MRHLSATPYHLIKYVMFSFTSFPSFQSDQASGIRLAIVMQNLTNVGTSLIISFVFGWELTLLILAIGPILIFVTAIGMKVLMGQADKDKKELEMAGKVGIFLLFLFKDKHHLLMRLPSNWTV